MKRRFERQRYHISYSKFAALLIFVYAAGWLFLNLHHTHYRFNHEVALTVGSSLGHSQNSNVHDDKVFYTLEEVYKAPPCQTFGCPIYPAEIDGPLVQHALELTRQSQVNSKQKYATTLFGSSNFATITRQSNNRQEHIYNQDRAIYIAPFVTNQIPNTESNKHQRTDKVLTSFLTGIFDGHGLYGHHMAAYVKFQLPGLLAEKLNAKPCCQDEAFIRQALSETFFELDRDAPPTAALLGGCTATVVLRIGEKLYFCNTGDSRSVLVQYTTTTTTTINHDDDLKILFETTPHKGNQPEELARITSLGGNVHIPPQNPNLSRVVVYSTASLPHESIGLAMSRSIGDWEWGAIGVIPDPTITVVDLSTIALTNNRLLLMTGSDGVWDLRKREFFARYFGEKLQMYSIKDVEPADKSKVDSSGIQLPIPPLLALHDLFYQIAPEQAKWYRDDMTLTIVKI